MFGSSVLAHLLILELLTQIATTNIAWSWRWWNERAGSNKTDWHSRKTWWVYMESWGLSKEDAQARNKYHAIKQQKNTINQHNHKLSSPGLCEDDPSPQLGFLRGFFLANHLASNANQRDIYLTRVHVDKWSLRQCMCAYVCEWLPLWVRNFVVHSFRWASEFTVVQHYRDLIIIIFIIFVPSVV